MDFFNTVEGRHSIRKYLGKEVEDEKLRKILECCNRAPSAGNLQSYKILIVRDPTRRNALSAVAGGQGALAQAPVALAFCANPQESEKRYGERGERLYSVQDATIAAAYCQLAATALGLATVWIGAFDEQKVKEILGTGLKPVALLPVGYAGEKPRLTGRKSLEELTEEI